MKDINELIKTDPELFDYPDYRGSKYVDPTTRPEFDRLPEYLKQGLLTPEAIETNRRILEGQEKREREK
ncbi:hypothetical protein [Candidatus Symbiobacter mobilis]|nr:hypothetical protein [Candidatus Symbiobacter mobilis]